jgi:hypothetical protein
MVSKPSIVQRLVEREVCGVVACEMRLRCLAFRSAEGVRLSGVWRDQAVRFGTRRGQGTGAYDDGFDRRRPGLILEGLRVCWSTGQSGSLGWYSVLHTTKWVLAWASSAPNNSYIKDGGLAMQQPEGGTKVSWGSSPWLVIRYEGVPSEVGEWVPSNSAKLKQSLEAMGGSAADQFTVRSGVCRAALLYALGNLLEGVPAALIRRRCSDLAGEEGVVVLRAIWLWDAMSESPWLHQPPKRRRPRWG